MIMRWSPHVMATRRQETTNPTSRGLNDKMRTAPETAPPAAGLDRSSTPRGNAAPGDSDCVTWLTG